MSYFSHLAAAERYAISRPPFHPLIIARIREQLELTAPLDRALDVACGTGQSTTPLRAIARHVVGADRSLAMLSTTPRDDCISYVAASAEQQPWVDESFDLTTVALAFHWFDREAFLCEAHRTLRSNGWLVIYNNSIYGRMHGNPAFENWFKDEYLARYPSPPRNYRPFTATDAHVLGFEFTAHEEYRNDVTFGMDAFAAYLMTQSNVIAAVEEGSEAAGTVQSWLIDALRPHFLQPTSAFEFGGTLWFLRKES
ncbi:MAG TPA: class I SAM-dependent methyltransferase [Nitrolancea sp.]|nr:class I SAM-dependent methyltransferase [Nitrolancea sp.]